MIYHNVDKIFDRYYGARQTCEIYKFDTYSHIKHIFTTAIDRKWRSPIDFDFYDYWKMKMASIG